MKTIVVIIAMMFAIPAFSQDLAGDIITAIKSGNAKDICKNFNDNIDLKVIDKEDVYSKSQAELIIKDFFSKHAPKSYSVAHKSTAKAGAEYTIGTLVDAAGGKFRVYFLIKKVNDKPAVQLFKIEPEND